MDLQSTYSEASVEAVLVVPCPGRGWRWGQLSESWLGTDSISLLSSDRECGGHVGNDHFYQGLDGPLSLQAL